MSAALSACTIASPAYHAHARVVAESFLEHHPGARFAIVDLGRAGNGAAGELADAPAGVELIDPRELLPASGELERLGLAYSTQGLAGALKPRALRHLLREQGGAAILIDSDICVYGPLDELGERAQREAALLTTHLITPHRGAELPTLLAGTFNSGFLVAGERGLPLLDWWAERTARECIFRPSAGMVWEQSWLGLAPAFFPLAVLRDPGVNAMTRELLDTDVEWRDGVPYLSGSRLRCLHYSGPYDPHEPDLLLSQAEEGEDVVWREGPLGGRLPWLSLERKPGAAQLSREYARRLLAAEAPAQRGAKPPFWRLREGLPVHQAMRSAYREALVEAEREGGPEPPNPFLDGEVERFLDWLAAPPSEAAAAQGLNRFALGAWRAQYADTAFAAVPGADGEEFGAWLRGRLGEQPSGIPPRLLPWTARGDAPRRPRRIPGLKGRGG